MNRDTAIEMLSVWVEEEPAETMQPFIDLDGKDYTLQDILIELKNDTEIGQAFVRCYDDVIAGVI